MLPPPTLYRQTRWHPLAHSYLRPPFRGKEFPPPLEIEVMLLRLTSFFLRLSRNSLALESSAVGGFERDRDRDLLRFASEAALLRFGEGSDSSSSEFEPDSSSSDSFFCATVSIVHGYTWAVNPTSTLGALVFRVDVRPCDGTSSPSALSSAESISP